MYIEGCSLPAMQSWVSKVAESDGRLEAETGLHNKNPQYYGERYRDRNRNKSLIITFDMRHCQTALTLAIYLKENGTTRMSVNRTPTVQLIYIAGDGLGYGFVLGSYSCSWQLGLESKSDSVQCENFCTAQCSHLVWSLNPSPNPAE